jgi:hypothetical protein
MVFGLVASVAMTAAALSGVLLAFAAGSLWLAIRRRGVNQWIGTYIREASKRRRRFRRCVSAGDVHLLVCIADHYEPRHGPVGAERAMDRVRAWAREYPRLFSCVRDSDGRPPRHTFFYPLEEYDPAEMNAIAGLCRQGYGEVEVHLHHDNDTAENLRKRLLAYTALLVERHGLLARRISDGQVMYGFVHGNWALDNSRPDGRWCGVNNELDILRETGCYADFTMPSAPSDTQTRKINSIYYACDDPMRPKSHDWGVDVGTGPAVRDSLMMVQGPLVLDWSRRRRGMIPRVENGCLQANQPPDAARVDAWLKAGIQVPSRPDWYFAKIYTHGAPEENAAVLLGEPALRFHEALAVRARKDPRFHFHYLTAREMYNVVRAAEAGFKGTVEKARDFELTWNGAVSEPIRLNEPVSQR